MNKKSNTCTQCNSRLQHTFSEVSGGYLTTYICNECCTVSYGKLLSKEEYEAYIRKLEAGIQMLKVFADEAERFKSLLTNIH